MIVNISKILKNLLRFKKAIEIKQTLDLKDMKKIAFVIGHHENSKGAYSAYFNCYEWDFYKDTESELRELGDVYTHDTAISSYKLRCKDTSEKINSREYDLVISLHFNSFNGKAEGVEALHINGNNDTEKLAKLFCESYSLGTGSINRGSKALSRGSRGFLELAYPKANAILLEPFFGDNEEDCKLFKDEVFIDSLKKVINEA